MKIRLSESDLHRLIKKCVNETVKRTLNEGYHHGYVGNEGNGRIGGSYGYTDGIPGSATLWTDDLLKQVFGSNFDVDNCPVEEDYLITATFTCGYDNSVGLGDYTEFNQSPQIEDAFYNDVEQLNCSDERKHMLIKLAEDKVEKMTEGEFDLDYPEYPDNPEW